jgi:hypothetical protein
MAAGGGCENLRFGWRRLTEVKPPHGLDPLAEPVRERAPLPLVLAGRPEEGHGSGHAKRSAASSVNRSKFALVPAAAGHHVTGVDISDIQGVRMYAGCAAVVG